MKNNKFFRDKYLEKGPKGIKEPWKNTKYWIYTTWKFIKRNEIKIYNI